MRKTKLISDPLYFFIELPSDFLPIVDSSIFQRLRRIKQLAFANLVYPSANHTRFEHSLGVMYLTYNFVKKLENLDEILLSLAGLLHDISHPPFSHSTDDLLISLGYPSHEGRIELFLNKLEDEIENLGYSKKEIIEAINTEIISGDLGTDRLDYLLRDSYHTGNRIGFVSLLKIYKSINIKDGKLIVDFSGVPSIEHFIIVRSLMRKTVYFHKTSLSATILFQNALLKHLEEGNLSYDKLIFMDDYDLHSFLVKEKEELYLRILNRNLFKKVLTISPMRNKISLDEIKSIEEEISEKFKLKFLIYPISYKKKKFRMNCKVLVEDKIVDFNKISSCVKFVEEVEKDINSIRIYCEKSLDKNKVNELKKCLMEML